MPSCVWTDTKRHGTRIGTGLTCQKIPCYMHDPACTWHSVKIAKII